MDVCRICPDVMPIKSRRLIFGPTFHVMNQLTQVLGYIPRSDDGQSKYVCGYCFTKLNKIAKIDYDLLHRLDVLRSEKQAIVSYLRNIMKNNLQLDLPNNTNTTLQNATATNRSKRELIHDSPTPRKVKRPLFTSPSPNQRTRSAYILPNSTADAKITNVISTTTCNSEQIQLFSPCKAQVPYFDYFYPVYFTNQSDLRCFPLFIYSWRISLNLDLNQ
jgi:hypothetical protein